MKKFLLFAAASTLAMAASAQTVIAPPTLETAQAQKWDALWGDYQYGYVLPNDYQLVDDDYVKVVMNNGSESKPGANVSTTGLNTTLFDRAFNMGSSAGYGYAEAVYSLDAISAGIKQPYAIFTVSAKVCGELTIYANRGKNKFSIYVWDKTANEGLGTYVLGTSAQVGDEGKSLVTEATVGLIQDHEYWVFGSETGSNILLYQMMFSPVSAPTYGLQEFDASKYSTVVLPPTLETAQTEKYDALWGDYQYGYVLPNGKTLVDNDELKVVSDNGSESKPGANVSTSGLNTTIFDRAFNMGSSAGFGFAEPVYSLDAISAGIKQPYAVLTVEAKKGGELTLFSNRGKNKYTIYVWDKTANEGLGTYVLASSTQNGDEGKGIVNEAIVGLIEGHTYWIFGSETGANILFYGMGFNGYTSPNYGYTGGTTAISDVIIETPKSDIIYNVMGQIVDENYKGLVIKNGKKYIQQ
ncbi:MAG: hypothetical protein K2K55_02045 [Duncaniella sp.]|nr:hypothetical protein [Duncaniella sp.]